MRILGLIGGMSWYGSLHYYKMINEGARQRLGVRNSAPIIMHCLDYEDLYTPFDDAAWARTEARIVPVARALEAAGAEGLVMCSNALHRVAAAIERAVQIPLIHVVDAVEEAIDAAGVRRPVLIGNRHVLDAGFYVARLSRRPGTTVLLPSPEDRTRIHDAIRDEVSAGIIDPVSRRAIVGMVQRLVEMEGADSVIFGCTEIRALLSAEDMPVPVFDSMTLHVDAALAFASRPVSPSGETSGPFPDSAPDRLPSSPAP